MASVVIDIASEFTGKKAFKQAETATDKLSKSVKSLGKTFGLTFGTAAVLAYAKASVKAAAADQKAQQQLALALKNVGLERDAASAERFIQNLQSEFGIVDDLLRPAYQKLAVATRDTAETQRLLGIALDISASTGRDLDTVTGALSKAYLGNNTALGKLGVGISKADLKTKSFKEITDDLATTFKGSAKAASETFAGSIAKLGVAAANVQEIIGTGLIDSLKTLGENTTIDELANDMERAALNLADFLRGLSQIGTFKVSGETKSLLGLLLTPFQRSLSAGPLGAITRIGAASRRAAEVGAQKNPIQSGSYLNSKAQTKAQTDLTKATKDQLKLAKAKAIFDLQKIQIEAALKGKISEEDRVRLLLLKAIQNENIDDIEKYTKMLDAVQDKVSELEATLADVYSMDAGNPYIAWEIGLDGVQRALIEIEGQSIALTNTLAQNSLAMGLMGGASFAQALSGARYAAQAAAAAGVTGNLGTLPDISTGGGGGSGGGGGNTVVTVNVAGTVTAQADLEKAIQDAINASNASGNSGLLTPKTWRGEV